MKRLSVYAVPDGALGECGQSWLGVDIRLGNQSVAKAPEALIRRPKRYGFHATIKAPFRAREEYDFDNMRKTLDVITSRHQSICVDLSLRLIGSFWALTPLTPSKPLAALARDVVIDMDRFRAPALEADLARRKPERLDRRQRALLAAWGYPYVLDQFTPHLTVTGPVPPAQTRTVEAELRAHFAQAIAEPWVIRSLALCGETAQGGFVVLHEAPLRARPVS